MESIDPSQLAWIKENSEEMQELEIEYPKSALPEEILEKLTNLRRKNQELWLLVHSEPLSEVLELIQYADEMSRLANRDRVLLVASIEKPEVGHIHWIPVYPARALFPYVDKIITACGFNLMQETKAYREKHHYMPFKRKWDDQWLRARLAGTFRII